MIANVTVTVAEKLVAAGFTVQLCNLKSHYDILIEGVLRVNVKSANKFSCVRQANGRLASGWCFNFRKNTAADLAALFRRDLDDVFWVPWYVIPNVAITLGETSSKYSKWQNNLEVIRQTLILRTKEKDALCS